MYKVGLQRKETTHPDAKLVVHAKVSYRCQNRRISGRGSRTVRLRIESNKEAGDTMFTQVRALLMEVIPYFLLD